MIKQDPCKDYIEKEREMLTKGRVEALGTHGKQTLNEIEADNNSNSRVFFFFFPLFVSYSYSKTVLNQLCLK